MDINNKIESGAASTSKNDRVQPEEPMESDEIESKSQFSYYLHNFSFFTPLQFHAFVCECNDE